MPSPNGFSALAYVANFGLVMVGGEIEPQEAVMTKDGYTFETLASPPFSTSGSCLAVIDDQTLLLTGGDYGSSDSSGDGHQSWDAMS